MTQDSSSALINTGISLTAASLTLTQIQPFVTLLAGFTAIISGIFAIRYYYKASKKYD
jgi:Trk-type K+ transport system membrane component